MSVRIGMLLPVRNTCYAWLQTVPQPLEVFLDRLCLFYYQPKPVTPESTKKYNLNNNKNNYPIVNYNYWLKILDTTSQSKFNKSTYSSF